MDANDEATPDRLEGQLAAQRCSRLPRCWAQAPPKPVTDPIATDRRGSTRFSAVLIPLYSRLKYSLKVR
jgi:hypothetical protein